MTGSSPKDNCAELWRLVELEYRYRNTPFRYRVLKLSMFSRGSGGYPYLKGKAHAIKHLGPILRDIFHSWHDESNPYHVGIQNALDSSGRLEEILRPYCSEFHLDHPNRILFRILCTRHVREQQALKDCGRKLFNITFNHHLLWHAGDRARYQTPRNDWCYMGEDVVLKIRTCASGTKEEEVHKTILNRMIRELESKVDLVASRG